MTPSHPVFIKKHTIKYILHISSISIIKNILQNINVVLFTKYPNAPDNVEQFPSFKT